ncbi:hypothetical protein [Bacillus cereus]|uniref:hypothetical protein n=1 Tax=Bacillus cereus TaxID=1396 RepID=UPI000B4B0B53|nr:hypothetical protein [Bacillus cereus]
MSTRKKFNKLGLMSLGVICALQVSPFATLDSNKVFAANEEQSSPEKNFGDARFHYANGAYYNAVHYASLAFKGGLQTVEVKTLLNNAAAQLSAIADQQAKDKQYNDAVINYQKLIDSDGVPANIKKAAQANSDIILAEFNKGTTALAEGKYADAVKYTSLSFAKGIYINRVVAQLKEASTQLSILSDKQTNNKQYNEAVEGYEILKNYYGVPADIKQAAEKNYDLIFKEYNAGKGYLDKGDFYNAVDLTSQSLSKGLTLQKVVDQLNEASTKLSILAKQQVDNKQLNEAVMNYTALKNTFGVPANIKEDAQRNYDLILREYYEAMYHFEKENYYNAVHYVSLSMAKGLSTDEVKTLMNKAADSLYKEAEEAEGNKQFNDAVSKYTALINAYGVPADVKEAAQKKYEVIMSEYKQAKDNFEKENYYNAVHYVSLSMAKGLSTDEVKTLMNRAADLLYKGAENYENVGEIGPALSDYTKLARAYGVPENIRQAAQSKLNSLQK